MQTDQLDTGSAISDIQLLLAEKRTALAMLRTGIAVLALPLSVLGLLVATSKYYHSSRELPFLIPFSILLLILIILGLYLVMHSLRQWHRYDEHIEDIKTKNKEVAEFVE